MKEFLIDQKNEGKKLFNFIKHKLPGLKNSEIFKLLRKKVITINNKKIDSNYLLKNNDIIKIFLADQHFEIKGKKTKFHSINYKLDIVDENENIIVVNKEKGLLTHPDKDNYKNNLVEYVKSYLYRKGEYEPENDFTPTPCHRLDRNTSGLIVFAKNFKSLKFISNEFKKRRVEKKYKTIVYGNIDRAYLLTSKISYNENIVNVEDFKKIEKIPAKMDFLEKNPEISATLIKPVKNNYDFSYIDIDLWTGKKHQIRAHLKAFDHPLLGDWKYYNRNSIRMSNDLYIKGYFLHSYSLRINEIGLFQSDLPDEFQNFIDKNFKKG